MRVIRTLRRRGASNQALGQALMFYGGSLLAGNNHHADVANQLLAYGQKLTTTDNQPTNEDHDDETEHLNS